MRSLRAVPVLHSTAVQFNSHRDVVVPRSWNDPEPTSSQRHLQFLSHDRIAVDISNKNLLTERVKQTGNVRDPKAK